MSGEEICFENSHCDINLCKIKIHKISHVGIPCSQAPKLSRAK